VVISEIFPNRIRGAAMSVAVFALWSACTALTFSFPFLNRALGAHGTFWLYGAICVAGFAYIALRLPETRGKSLEEIERTFA
jgi:SP family sugar porter-like MFS transporter